MTIHNPWETSPSKSSLVNIGTHRLFTRVTGPPRAPGSPIIIIEAGGGSTSTFYLGLIHALSSSYRFLSYNRAGLADSDPAPTTSPRSATEISNDFEALLKATGIAGPYILFAHSYAGVQVRTWMEVHGRIVDVVGAVFMDTATEELYARLPIREVDWGFLTELSVGRVLGYDACHRYLSEDEYERIQQNARVSNEKLAVDESARRLGEFRQFERQVLGNKPVSVIKGFLVEDLRRLCVEAERVGHGTTQQRRHIMGGLAEMDAVFEDTERQQLSLSSNSRLVYTAKEAGHAILFQDPETVFEEIRWVVEQCNK